MVNRKCDQSGDVRILNQGVGDVGFGAHQVGVIRAHVDDLDLRALQCLFDALVTVLGVLRIGLADEGHDLAAVGQHLFDQLASLFARRVIVGAEVAGAIALRRIAVLRQHQRLFGDIVDHLRLISRIDGREGDAVSAFGEQVVDDTLLFGSRAFAGNLEFNLDVVKFLIGFLAAAPRNRPEVGGIVSNKGNFFLFAGGRAADE